MREVWNIHGGIHPAEQKDQSNKNPIVIAAMPDELVIPVLQHIGAPAAPVVQVGDRVLKGQLIAEAQSAVSVPVHSSSSGQVIAIEPRPVAHPSALNALCIVIKTDGKDQWIDCQGVEDYRQRDKSALLEIIRQAGIAGMGGAGFPSAVKLNTRSDQRIETLIINGTECEPYITADDRLMRERAEQVIAGATILSYIVDPSTETLIGVEDNKPEAIAALQRAAADSGIEIVSFPTKYPSGGEKQLIQILTGKEVPSQGLPADVGIVCQNVGTCVAIHEAITTGRPLISRITTVTGNACNTQQNFEVLLGTPVHHLLAQCGFEQSRCSRLVMGGPMMGFTLENTSVPVVKTTNCLLAPTTEELPAPPAPQACIRCGMCAEACPVKLLPQQLYWFARGKEYDKLQSHNLHDCIECGACSYVCPSNIPLVQYYRASKAAIRSQTEDHSKAEHSKQRFEARKQRLERLEQEKQQKRAERQAAAKARAKAGSDSKTDVIQAAIERAKAKKAAANPAQAAIEKAQQQRAQQTQLDPIEKAQQSVDSFKKRLHNAQQKLAEATEGNDDKVEIFASAVEKMQAKLQQAEQQLAELTANPRSSEEKPVDDIVARALAKREAARTMTDEQKLQNAVDSLTKRLEKAQQKLADAQQQDSEHIEILADSVDKLTKKLADAKTELAQKV